MYELFLFLHHVASVWYIPKSQLVRFVSSVTECWDSVSLALRNTRGIHVAEGATAERMHSEEPGQGQCRCLAGVSEGGKISSSCKPPCLAEKD